MFASTLRHLKAELEEIRSELQLHKSTRIKELKGKVSRDRFPHGSIVDKCLSTEVTLCKRGDKNVATAKHDDSCCFGFIGNQKYHQKSSYTVQRMWSNDRSIAVIL